MTAPYFQLENKSRYFFQILKFFFTFPPISPSFLFLKNLRNPRNPWLLLSFPPSRLSRRSPAGTKTEPKSNKSCFNTLKIKKFQPKFAEKNKKSLLLTQKPTKPPFTPCYFWSKRVKSWSFFGKKGKKREKIGKKVKKGKFLKIDFPKSTQKHPK